MLKTPQDYWEEIADQLPVVDDDITGMLRVAFFYGVSSTVNFLGELNDEPDKSAAFIEFVKLVDAQQVVERAIRDAKKNRRPVA